VSVRVRDALVFAPVVLGLGLAAYFAVGSGRDAPARAASGNVTDSRAAAVATPVTVTAPPPAAAGSAAPQEAGHATAASLGSAEPELDLANVVPPAADEIAADRPARGPLETPRDRIARLVAGGFSEQRAAAIVQRESQVRLAAASAEYERSGTVRALSAATEAAVASAIRSELGDADYERYLSATGQPTRVVVGEVEPGSAAANAGLMPGDEIRSYRGQRVFNAGELNASMLAAAIGETVATTVVRDGQPLQLYVSGGPLGMAAQSAR
jgi:S1-C subfamily serine protease